MHGNKRLMSVDLTARKRQLLQTNQPEAIECEEHQAAKVKCIRVHDRGRVTPTTEPDEC